jgi:hypothetical protein
MRNMSFALTQDQLLNGTKCVTRRIGWQALKVGDTIQPVLKSMGLKKGEKVAKLGPTILIHEVRRERLGLMLEDLSYGEQECRAEGFPGLIPAEFVEMFCKAMKGCNQQTLVTRIAFVHGANGRESVGLDFSEFHSIRAEIARARTSEDWRRSGNLVHNSHPAFRDALKLIWQSKYKREFIGPLKLSSQLSTGRVVVDHQ